MIHSFYVLVLLLLGSGLWSIVVCKSEEPNGGFLLFSNGISIESIHVSGDSIIDPPLYKISNDQYVRRVIALAFDYEGERLFYSDITRGEILTTFLNGTNIRVVVKDVRTVEGLAYEGSGGDLYFTSYSSSSISKINVNDALNDVTIEPNVLIQQTTEEHPRGIIIENCYKSMYWTTWGGRPSIRRANLTGGDVQDIITTDIETPNDLAFDQTTNMLYWTDAKLDKIEKCEMDGSNRVIISSVDQHSYGLAVLGDYVYWTDWLTNAVIRINKNDGTSFTHIRDLKNNVYGILAVDRQSDKCLVDKCLDDDHECQDVCTTDYYGRVSCQCTYGILDTDGKTCKVVTQIIKAPEDQRIVKGATAILHCGVSHYAKIDVTWRWTYRRLNWNIDEQIISDYRHSMSVNGTLTIKGVTDADVGKYTCNVKSIGGNDERSAELTVIDVPLAPVITSVALYPDDKRAAAVSWVQGFDGNAPITKFLIEYKEVSKNYENKGWVTFDSNIHPEARESIVTDLRPYTSYKFRVTASNEAGDSSPSFPQPSPPLLIPQLPPSCYPKDFYGMPSTNSSVTLSWLHPDEDSWNGPELGGYIIQYKRVGSADVIFQRITVNILTDQTFMKYELKGLEIYQKYDMQIAAFNKKGVGVFSPSIKVATLEGRPTASPEDIRVSVLNSTAVLVTWTPPDQQFINGKNLGYKVLTSTPVREPSTNVTIAPHDQTNDLQQATILNLKPYTRYEVSVLCFTSHGDGPQSVQKRIVTAEDVPSQVGGLYISDVTEVSLDLKWELPSEPNGLLTGYTIQYWEKNASDTRQRVDLDYTVNMYSLTNLSPMTIYTISVSASTSAGNGPSKSLDAESWVPQGYPLPPLNIGCSYIDSRSVLLQFIPGFDGGNPVSSYIIEALEGNMTSEWKTIHTHMIKDPVPAILVENLKPYTLYKVRVTAVNVVGQSFPSKPTRMFKTFPDVPETPPRDLDARALNATALRITWKPLSKSDWNGEPKGYKIYYKLKDTDETFEVVDLDADSDRESYIIDGLLEWSPYEVSMIAYNDIGHSKKTSTELTRTMESVPSKGPQNVEAAALSSTSIKVSWSGVPDLYQNGLILGYKVEYKSPLDNISAEYKDVPGQSTDHVVIEHLQIFVLYEVRVLAYTRMGDGVFSYPEIIVKTMGGAPSPPSSVWFPTVSYHEVTIEWQRPLEPHGLLTGHRLAYRLKDSGDDFITDSYISSVDTRYTVQNLHKEALYEFQLAARSHVEWGETVSLEVYTTTDRGAPPQQPMPHIDYSSIEARSMTISWVPALYNINSPIRNFTVQYKRRGNSWDTVLEPILASVERYKVKGLLPDTEYQFRVAASNDMGTSPYSLGSFYMFTAEDKPEGVLQHVTVERITRTSVKVRWDEPVPGTLNGRLDGYVLTYRQLGDTSNTEVDVSKYRNEKVINNLAKFVYYQFLVQAYNRIGRGPPSPEVTVFVGEAAPSAAPVDIETFAKSSTQIRVTWLPPPLESQNGDLSGYRVSYWRSKDIESTAEQVTTKETAIVLRDLDIYTEYGVRVQAINQVGEGPVSETKLETTSEELPGKPVSVKFWNVMYTSLEVHWEPPEKPNGKIIEYHLTYEEHNPIRGSQEVKIEVPSDSHQLNIKDLRENATYTFLISASTSKGQGAPTEESFTLGPQPGSPGAPHQLKYNIEDNGRKLTLGWESGAEGQLPTTGHEIQVKQSYSCTWMTVKKIGSETSVKLNLNLKPFKPETKYRLRVIAWNAYGVSPYSTESKQFKTPEKNSQRFLVFSASYYMEALNMSAVAGEDPVMFKIENGAYMRRVIGLAFDYEHERIFYSNIGLSSKNIASVSFDGTQESVIVEDGIGTIEDLTFEKTGGDLYFTSYTIFSIGKINVNDALTSRSRDPEFIVQLTEEDRPRGIAVDSCLKVIYWTNWSSKPRIQRADLNGGDVTDIVSEDIKFPNSIVIDHISKNLYWTDAGKDTIERCDMDGSNRVVVIELESSHPFGLTVYGESLFWTDWKQKAVMRADKVDGNNIAIIRHGLSHSPMGIIAVADDSEECEINKCYGDDHGCGDVCYTDISGEPSCRCTSGKLNDDLKTCS